MFIWMVRYYLGYVKVSATGKKCERFINLCKARNISIWQICCYEDRIDFYIYANDYKKLIEIVRKTGLRTKIQERYGLPFFLYKNRKRKAFMLGILTSFLIIYGLSMHIWDITFEGNFSHSKYEILDFLQTNNVYHGIKKNEIDCEAIEKLIRNEYNDITWVSVEIRGTRMLVHIKENFDENDAAEDKKAGNEPCSLVSTRDAIIESIITRSGVAMVKAGDVVTEGTLLISGTFDVMGDYEEYIRTEQVKAQGDVYGLVTYEINEEINREYVDRNYTGNEITVNKYRFNQKEFELSLKKPDFEYYDRIENENQISLVSDFYIPVYLGQVVYREYVPENKLYTDNELKNLANKKINVFLENLSKKGIQIKENNVTIDIGEKGVSIRGNVKAVESLGREVPIEVQDKERNLGEDE